MTHIPTASGPGALIRALDEAPPYEFSAELDQYLRDEVGADGCILLLADYSEETLEPVPGPHVPDLRSRQLAASAVTDSPAGQAFRQQCVVNVASTGNPWSTVYVPVTMRSERLGVLEVRLPRMNDQILCALRDAGRITAYALAAARRYTDRFEQIRRRRDFILAAEIQWELLPVLAYETSQFALAGNLEPAYEIAGDTFDYAVAKDRLTVTITDAMGHGLRAALLGSLAVTTMRNKRRTGSGIYEQAVEASAQLGQQFGDGAFVQASLSSSTRAPAMAQSSTPDTLHRYFCATARRTPSSFHQTPLWECSLRLTTICTHFPCSAVTDCYSIATESLKPATKPVKASDQDV